MNAIHNVAAILTIAGVGASVASYLSGTDSNPPITVVVTQKEITNKGNNNNSFLDKKIDKLERKINELNVLKNTDVNDEKQIAPPDLQKMLEVSRSKLRTMEKKIEKYKNISADRTFHEEQKDSDINANKLNVLSGKQTWNVVTGRYRSTFIFTINSNGHFKGKSYWVYRGRDINNRIEGNISHNTIKFIRYFDDSAGGKQTFIGSINLATNTVTGNWSGTGGGAPWTATILKN